MNTKSENIVAGVFLIALLLGGILLLGRRAEGGTSRPLGLSRGASGGANYLPVVEDTARSPAKRYQNKEVREIEWREGYPIRITITRDYAIA